MRSTSLHSSNRLRVFLNLLQVYSVLKSSRFSGLSFQTLVIAWLDKIPFIHFIYQDATTCKYDDLLFDPIFEFPACAVKGVSPVTFREPH